MVVVLNHLVKEPVLIIVPLLRTSVPLFATDNPSIIVFPLISIFPWVIVNVVPVVTLFINRIPAPVLLTVRFVKFSPPGEVMVCKAAPLKFTLLVASVNPAVPRLTQLPSRLMVLAPADKIPVPLIVRFPLTDKLLPSVLVFDVT